MNWIERLRRDETFLRSAFYLALALGFLVRLWHLTAPIADDQSWAQTSTATVLRHYVENGVDFLHPEWDVLQDGPAAPRNIEAEEAPLYHLAATWLAHLFGIPSEAAARLLSIIASLLGAVFLFRLMRRLSDGPAALFTAVFFLFAPFSWYFGRTILSDTWMLAAMIIAVERYEMWLRCDCPWALLSSVVAVAFAGLFKAFALHIGVTLVLMQIAAKGWRSLLDRRLIGAALIALVPPLVWIAWAAHVGSLGNVVHAGESVFTAQNLWGPLRLLWTGHFWFMLQARLFDQMATPFVAVFALLGLLFADARKQAKTALFWLAGFLFYVALVRDGQKHNYYQLPALPAFTMLAGLGLSALSRRVQGKWIALLLAGFLLVATLYVLPHFRLDLSGPRAGELVRLYSLSDDLVVVLDPGVTRKNQVNYAAHRRGWHANSLRPGGIEQFHQWGARWLVTCLDDDQLKKHPEWLELANRWTKVAEDRGRCGPQGEMHSIAVYDLSEPAAHRP